MSGTYTAPKKIGGRIFLVVLLMLVIEAILGYCFYADFTTLNNPYSDEALRSVAEKGVVGFSIGIVVVLITGIVIMVKIKQKHDREIYQMYKAAKERELAAKNATSTVTASKNTPLSVSGSTLSMQRVVKDMQTATRTKKYGDFLSIQSLCEDFIAFAKDEGVDVDFEDVRSIFAAMAAARAIWFQCTSPEYAETVVLTLKKYFGGLARSFVVDETMQDTKSVLYAQVGGKRTATPLLEDLYSAKFIDDAIFTSAVKHAELCTFGKVFYPFIQGCRAPEGNTEMIVDYFGDYRGFSHIEGKKMTYPKNFWLFLIMGNEKGVLPKKAVEYSYIVRLKEKEPLAAESGEREKHYPISYSQFNELIMTAVDEHFISLDLWKKVDKVEEYLQAKLPFVLLNPVVRQMEYYTSVCIACGMTQTEAIDDMLAGKIFPMLKGYTKEEVNQEGQSLAECIDALFGMENLPLTHKLLTDLELD